MNSRIPTQDDVAQTVKALLQVTDALMLATVTEGGVPEASYTPYVEHDGSFYIFISGLASHTKNINQSGVASVLFVQAGDKIQAHTRQRLSCHCEAGAISREAPLFDSIMGLMEARFGKLIQTLRGLGDFQLIRLTPTKGNFVAGFGQAFEVNFPLGDGIRHLNGD